MGQMRKRAFNRPTGRRRRALALATMLIGALAALGAASPALASLKQDLQRFSDCPIDAGVAECVFSTTTGGEFVIGNSAVPITKTVTIQGGLEAKMLVPAVDGNTLSKTALPVPGGLIGITLPGDFSEVTATAELAGQGEIGVSVLLPLKVKLDNPLLGSGCYVGSESEPLTLGLVYGRTNPPPPNKSISGSSVITTLDNGRILRVEGTLVDNAFAAPGATGCTLLPLVGDAAVNVKEGLPAAAGSNTAIMSGTTEMVKASIVREVLPLPELGRCVKAESAVVGGKTIYKGGYTSSACTTAGGGKYEWVAGPGAGSKFAGTTTTLKLETVGKSTVTCTAGSSEGEYTGQKTETVSFKLTGCVLGPKGSTVSCQSNSAKPGEIQTATLKGALEFVKENELPEKPVVGMDLKAASGPNLATFECGGSSVSVSGSVIAPITAIDKMATSFKLKAKASGGVQSPEAFEGGPKDTLTFAPSGGGEEQAGLTGASTSANEEPLEIKAL